MTHIIVPKIESVTIRQEGDRVVVVSNGKAVLDLPWNAALEVAAGIRAKAKLAEEQAHLDALAYDSAVMLRAGLPFVMSNRPDVLAVAKREAAWGDLRRYMPDRGIRSQEKFGTPKLTKHPPRRLTDG
ncbi:MAG: hypothetical protein KDJ65_01635 [Anaerolineae bacterium]|nr:hypothetical protein [Anaerolineae bacterium]